MKKKKEENKPNNATEQQPLNGSTDASKTIRFFSSFEEMNEYDIMTMAEHTPLQRLENINYLIRGMFADELEKPLSDLTLHFK